MSGAADPAAERLGALLELLGRARRALASGELDEVTALMRRIEALGAGIARLIEADRQRQREAVLALLDEAEGLSDELGAARRDIGAALRGMAARRRAQSAYRRTRAR